jgi:7-cyano-7-deazaguanine reductase
MDDPSPFSRQAAVGTIPDSPLGKSTHYPDAYDASLLYPVERAPQREALGLAGALPFAGEDRWTAWEVTWLDAAGRPRAGIATLDVPCTSPRIVESKSVKLYLASLNHERFDAADALEAVLRRDLSEATGAGVRVALDAPDAWPRHARAELAGDAIDDAMPSAFAGAPDPALLRTVAGEQNEALVWHGFRSVCPVTGQPDYASLRIAYRGPAIDRGALVAYLFGFRRHPGFHEHCVERIFVDLCRACAPRALTVEARFTRRGGVDINPIRSNDADRGAAPSRPTWRQ